LTAGHLAGAMIYTGTAAAAAHDRGPGTLSFFFELHLLISDLI
jgi:hypothetical protein